uniref:Uncharacterized protein n=1 Tax=Panagrolaimus sp. JU765 TaxID=591449 RepID=A0AC34Q1T0_9BILA
MPCKNQSILTNNSFKGLFLERTICKIQSIFPNILPSRHIQSTLNRTHFVDHFVFHVTTPSKHPTFCKFFIPPSNISMISLPKFRKIFSIESILKKNKTCSLPLHFLFFSFFGNL